METEKNKDLLTTFTDDIDKLPGIVTLIASGVAGYYREAYIKIVGDKVIFDHSDEEYGPMVMDLSVLEKAILNHKAKTRAENYMKLKKGYKSNER